MDNPFLPKTGSRVVTLEGLEDHGPAYGPKVTVPAETIGRIVRRGSGSGGDVWHVKWSTGAESGHYTNNMMAVGHGRQVCLGDCGDMHSLSQWLGEVIERATGAGNSRTFAVRGTLVSGDRFRWDATRQLWELVIRPALLRVGRVIE